MLVKICGITNTDDARFALTAGADWIGLNLVAGPRRINLATATAIADSLDDPSSVVALLHVDGSGIESRTLSPLQRSGIVRVQLYGDVDTDSIARLNDQGLSCVLVHRVADERSFDEVDAILHARSRPAPDYVLLDANTPGMIGGSGRCADWNVIARMRDARRFDRWPPILLAGGLNAANVASAIKQVRPAGVDVSSGVERAPGTKDHEKVTAFLSAVREGV